ncbi:MAG: hypothetical protein RLZZ546_3078, partial [Bacteroidota bacterium]
VLYFVSDRIGGFGGYDVWYSIINNGVASKPLNCGKKINSARDEITPFYNSAEQMLYFSSNFHTGYGGYDIFKSKGQQQKWTTPVNLDLPLNSSYDDTYYQRVPNNIVADTLEKALLATNRPGVIALKNESCCEDIFYAKEYLPKFIDIDIIVEQTVTLTDSIVTRDSIQFDSAKTKYWKYVDKKIARTRDTTVAMTGTKIGLVKKVYADEAKKLGRFTPEGMKDQIEWLDTNNTGKLTMSLQENKAYVMVVIKDSMESIVKEFTSSENQTFSFNMKKVIKKDTVENIALSGTLGSISEETVVQENQKFLLENMYFDTDKDVIKEASLPSLELLLTFMEARPNVTIEIAGHTDSQGNDAHNQDLSQRRAETVKKYLIAHGVKEKRLVAKGYGETKPISENETAEGRKLNRRTEIIILSTE